MGNWNGRVVCLLTESRDFRKLSFENGQLEYKDGQSKSIASEVWKKEIERNNLYKICFIVYI